MKLKPVNDKIVIRPIEKKDDSVTAGGIILPDTMNEGTLNEGEVIAAGHGMHSANGTLIPICVNVGDRVLYGKHSTVGEYKLNGETVFIMSQNEILSILKGE